jgi:hypothetical protein
MFPKAASARDGGEFMAGGDERARGRRWFSEKTFGSESSNGRSRESQDIKGGRGIGSLGFQVE